MNTLRLTVHPKAAFGTPLAGDTLFGHMCWAIRGRFGEARLSRLLEGYTEGHPFAVVSDAFPSGYVPVPTLPAFLMGDAPDRKARRGTFWMPASDVTRPLREWTSISSEVEVAEQAVLTQNTINRLTGSTGTDQFAPRQVSRFDFGSRRLDVYCVLDESRLTREELQQILEDIGQSGYGRDASTGLGKFMVVDLQDHHWPEGDKSHVMTLAPCASDPRQVNAAHCYYRPLTRFGRHGNVAALQGQPFKRPVLMAGTAAFLTLKEPGAPAFLGLGLGGNGKLSRTIKDSVHQGYAPVVPLNAELEA